MFGLAPAEAGIGNRDTMQEGHTFFPCLSAGVQVAFEHETHDGLTAFAELFKHFVGHESLSGVILLGIVMRTIDHDRAGDPFSGDRGFSLGDIVGFVVGASPSAAEHDMAIGIAHGLDDGGLAVGVDADEVVRGAGGSHGINGNLEAAFGSIFEPDRHGHTAGHFPMGLAFGRACSDRGPADQVGDILRTDRIEQFRAARKTQLIDLEQDSPRQFHARCNITGSIEMGIVDESFPADGGSRLFKIGPHHDQEAVTQGIGNQLQLSGIFVGSFGIMDGTGAHDDQQPVPILAMENLTNRFSGFDDECRSLIGNGQFGLNGARGWQRLDFNNVLIVNRSIHDPSRSLVWFSSDSAVKRGGKNLTNNSRKVHTA
jgi:hypothetical protein